MIGEWNVAFVDLVQALQHSFARLVGKDRGVDLGGRVG